MVKKELSHLDADGNARMVDVSDKEHTLRQATACAMVSMRPETLALITCGGEFDRTTRRYKQNIVVYAVPIVEMIDLLPSF